MNKITFVLDSPYSSESKGSVGLGEGVIKAAWPKLTDDEKSGWLKDNPDSEAHSFKDKPASAPAPAQKPKPEPVNKGGKPGAKVEPEEDADTGSNSGETWWDKLSSDEQDAYLERHPRSRRRKTHTKGSLLKHAVLVSSNKVHHAMRSIGKSYRRGMRGLRNLKAGRPMSGAEKEGLKKTGLVVATVVIAALAAAALFTPIGGAALDVSTDYLTWLHEHLANTGQASGDQGQDSEVNRQTLKEFHDGMLKWLLDQDPETLTEKYGKKS